MSEIDRWDTERAGGTDPSSEPLGCTIRVLRGDASDVGKHFVLAKGTALVGTSSSADMRLHDKQVSRRHLEIRVVPRGVGLRDLNSSNGSFVLGSRVTDVVVPYGSQVRIGATTLELMPLAENVGGDRYGDLIGASESMQHLFALLKRIEASDVSVLVIAETGTGKELVARGIHEHSVRKNKPFVVFDCASVPRELVESELFGHVKGAFTGAQGDRQGVFEQADGGTLFLDEIGELPAETQTRLLRALERGEVKPVGANGYRSVNVRIVAATHRDLRECVQQGTFRADLYYRLGVVPITIPPLRERASDIPLLVTHFGGGSLSDGVVHRFSAQAWPGNVRELKNAVSRLVVLGEDEHRDASVIADTREPGESLPYKEAKEKLVDAFEEKYLRDLLARHNDNVSAAAREAGLSRRHMHELLRKHGLRTDD